MSPTDHRDDVERLIAGDIPPWDAPLARFLDQLRALTAPPPDHVDAAHRAALATAARRTPAGPSVASTRPRRWPRRLRRMTAIGAVKLVAGATFVAAATGGGLAATGSLPDPAQHQVAELLGRVGIDVPDPGDEAAIPPAVDRPQPGPSADATSSSSPQPGPSGRGPSPAARPSDLPSTGPPGPPAHAPGSPNGPPPPEESEGAGATAGPPAGRTASPGGREQAPPGPDHARPNGQTGRTPPADPDADSRERRDRRDRGRPHARASGPEGPGASAPGPSPSQRPD